MKSGCILHICQDLTLTQLTFNSLHSYRTWSDPFTSASAPMGNGDFKVKAGNFSENKELSPIKAEDSDPTHSEDTHSVPKFLPQLLPVPLPPGEMAFKIKRYL